MPIHMRENQYLGVNAHLQSFLQSPGGGWEMFHAAHITHLTEAIDTILPDGYFVLNEKSLQLSALDFESGEQRLSRTKPDVSIYGESTSFPTDDTSVSPTLTLPLIQITVEDDPLTSALIYDLQSGEEIPIARIELLSPANKPPGSHYRQYLRKRQETLDNGIVLVEIDYLHESHLLPHQLPSYPDNEPESYPYLILVSDPRPSLARGHTFLYGFHIDEAIPKAVIPLARADSITVDFGAIYNTTFTSNRYYGLKAVDYEPLPVRFDTYNSLDQQRIHDRMAIVKQASAL